ncbi:leucine-rich repeat-containing G-protein coupled receptor 4-like [Mercenaria mercenaria]|uniref:leucine-rich repeat-containing G-protein coupled receptor 4-like n=1 Tax=Mercenaria mercenaria TaxID=6596 RepID=UPI00234F5BD1|nr:leucine-rich repeat-containing G-protein coupled receptor 4-like [Mercenaria mercenaria]
MKLPLLTVIVAISQISEQCYGFLLNEKCLVPPPCSCPSRGINTITIICEYNEFNSTPTFEHVGIHAETLDIQLQFNKIETVTDNAFRNLSSVSASTINIRLDHNAIFSLSENAFAGIENSIKLLELENNNLTSLPSVIGKLKTLEYLDIRSNPLRSLSYSVMSNIGHTLNLIFLDLKLFSIWPNEIGLLHCLQSLWIQSVPFTNLKTNVFHNFENSLTALIIEEAQLLETIPLAVCQLSVIQTLRLNNFHGIKQNESSIFQHCTEKRRSLTSLQLVNNNLDSFPDALHVFPSLAYLYLRSNNLESIEVEQIPTNTLLKELDLIRNRFQRIPAAMNELTNLETLYLKNNNISAIEDADFTGLVKLESLYLAHNPITYISKHAFKNNAELSTLDLSYSQLKSIPFAITILPKLVDLDVRYGGQISCTCNMSYLKGWNASRVRYFEGKCANSTQNIQDFIMTSLTHCP